MHGPFTLILAKYGSALYCERPVLIPKIPPFRTNRFIASLFFEDTFVSLSNSVPSKSLNNAIFSCSLHYTGRLAPPCHFVTLFTGSSGMNLLRIRQGIHNLLTNFYHKFYISIDRYNISYIGNNSPVKCFYNTSSDFKCLLSILVTC